MTRYLVTGGASGLGAAIVEELQRTALNEVAIYDRNVSMDLDVRLPNTDYINDFKPEVLINCAGVNLINWAESVDEQDWDSVMDTNAKGMFLMAQACMPHLEEANGTILNIVSNAAHMPMRCSAAYNASKGAALILTKQLARELIGKGITVFSVSPNKMGGTKMSDSIDRQVVETRGWTIEEAQAYQLAGLLTGEETPPQKVAELIAYLLSEKDNHKYLAGCDIPYGL